MKTGIPGDIVEKIADECLKVTARLTGTAPAVPMEVVLLHTENHLAYSVFIVAFRTQANTIAYIDEEDNLIEIDYNVSKP